jgi:hypothetical protein
LKGEHLLKNKDSTVHEEGFLIAVEIEEPAGIYATSEAISDHIKESLNWIEGVGRVDTHYLGPIETIEDEEK